MVTGQVGLVAGAAISSAKDAWQIVLVVYIGLLAISCLGALLFSAMIFWIPRISGDAAPMTRRALAGIALTRSGHELHRVDEPADQAAVSSGLMALTARDPYFNEIVIVEAAHRALFFVFVMQCTGGRGRLEQVATAEFWRSTVGVVLQRVAGAQQQIQANRARLHAPDGEAAERGAITTLDFHAGAATIRMVQSDQGGVDRVTLRVGYGGRCVATGMIADRFLAAHSKSRFQISPGPGAGAGLAQIELRGWYDLEFVRPVGVATGIGGEGRRCYNCGAPFHSDLDTACPNCRQTRITPEGEWLLARGWLVVA